MEIELTGANIVNPGDTLVLTTKQQVSLQQATDLKTGVEELLPKNTNVIVIVGVDATIVRNSTKETTQ